MNPGVTARRSPGQFPVDDPANQMLGHEPAPVNAGQLFLADKLQVDRARDRG